MKTSALIRKIYTVGIFIIIILITILIMYFSWLDSPKIGASAVIPSWMKTWVDKTENDTIRTAVPFVILGIVCAMYLIQKRKERPWWIFTFMILAILIFLAETGQLFLPRRIFDWRDIVWGITGAGLGLTAMYTLVKFIKRS